MNDYAAKIFSAYGLSPVRFLPPQKGYRNTSYAAELPDGRMVNIIVYKCESGSTGLIKRANAVGDHLAELGLPARKTYDKRILCLNTGSTTDKRYAALYDYLPGATIAWEAYTQDHIKVLGMGLSTVHASLKDFDGSGLPRVHEQYSYQLERMTGYFNQPGVQRAMAAKLRIDSPVKACAALQGILRHCSRLPAQQALHMDYVRGNILFQSIGDIRGKARVQLAVDGTSISGILDFEKTAFGHPLFDIARTLAFLLVDCKYKTEPQVRKYFLHSGYAKRGPAALPLVKVMMSEGRIDLLEKLINVFLLHDLYKFLRHNPYESLAGNEHYRRTVDLAQQRGLVIPM